MITLYNNLRGIQPIRVRDKHGADYTMFIEGKKSINLEVWQITADIKLKLDSGTLLELSNTSETIPTVTKNFEDNAGVEVDETPEEISETLDEDVPEEETTPEEDTTPEEETTPEEDLTPSVEDQGGKFICDVCGNEFATKRGLDMHKSRAHN